MQTVLPQRFYAKQSCCKFHRKLVIKIANKSLFLINFFPLRQIFQGKDITSICSDKTKTVFNDSFNPHVVRLLIL